MKKLLLCFTIRFFTWTRNPCISNQSVLLLSGRPKAPSVFRKVFSSHLSEWLSLSTKRWHFGWHYECGSEPPFLQLDATPHCMWWNQEWFVLRPEGLLNPLICHLAKYHAFPVVICVLFVLLFRTCPEELSQTEI